MRLNKTTANSGLELFPTINSSGSAETARMFLPGEGISLRIGGLQRYINVVPIGLTGGGFIHARSLLLLIHPTAKAIRRTRGARPIRKTMLKDLLPKAGQIPTFRLQGRALDLRRAGSFE